ncbi:hypothetical protein [Candidatus Viridilinea mediisalina]|uniref:Uncharacterized protein n=1 Tax=Candidatus Viridilinea mediisalina TaxID=2024553 RepID=A0A2A6RJW3_9CHLR|nr:hypothetical protein [Candidatus Viridilinea mediisalina]PDW03357.1 hypothetical protein CJ255_09230 [Candidatus Viridilinea mediisalina]
MTIGNRIFTILFGLVFVVMGVGGGFFVARETQQQADRIAQLDPLSASAVAQADHGQEVLVEGVISADNPTLYRNFVAYREERLEHDGDDDLTWRRLGTTTQPLRLEAGGVIQISNQDYRLNGSHVTSPSTSRNRPGELRYSGIVHGRTVTAIGNIVQSGNERTVNAHVIFAGTQEQFIRSQRTGSFIFACVGGIFATFGVLIIIHAFRERRSSEAV